MMLKRLVRAEPCLKSSNFQLNVRLVVFLVAWLHLCIAAVVILPLDMSADEDHRIRAYSRLKWRFITAWFNLINLGYLPLCMYCDWKEKRGEENQPLVGSLRRIRDITFTSILFPVTTWADFLFWRFYCKDMSLIAPPRLFNYMPPWGQHSLHTVSLGVALLDLLLIPRTRPERLKPRLILLLVFLTIYCAAIMERYLKGEMVYQVQEMFSATDAILFTALCYIENILYFSLQWYVIQFLWGKRFEVRKTE